MSDSLEDVALSAEEQYNKIVDSRGGKDALKRGKTLSEEFKQKMQLAELLLENLSSTAEDNMSSAQPVNVRLVELMGNSTDWRKQLDFPLLQVKKQC